MTRLQQRIKRFRRLQQLAEAGERRAEMLVANAQRRLSTDQQRLHELKSYAFRDTPRFASAAHLENSESFAARLRLAVRQQADVVKETKQALDQSRSEWFSARQSTERFRAALQRLDDEQQTVAARELMRQLDDHAARVFSRSQSRDT
ncbi:MAG: flagellar FliJ family protein [Pseudomonadota bacterium]